MCMDDFQFDFFGRTKVIVLGVSENNPTTAENTCYSDDDESPEMDELRLAYRLGGFSSRGSPVSASLSLSWTNLFLRGTVTQTLSPCLLSSIFGSLTAVRGLAGILLSSVRSIIDSEIDCCISLLAL